MGAGLWPPVLVKVVGRGSRGDG
nr:hypothetical protein [Tanacetum cinerariifolium]